MDKLDGSMIRPIHMKGIVRLATKMGVTDIAVDAEKLLTPEQLVWLDLQVFHGYTPLFEYVAPTNKIVVHYDQPELIMTAIRNNITGEYINIHIPPHTEPFKKVRVDSSIYDIDAFLRFKGDETGREGDIIRFNTGHMLKVKNDWYVQIHKTKDIVAVDRNIVELILNEKLDDTRSRLDPADHARVDEVEAKFWEAFNNCEDRISGLELIAYTVYEGDKKRIALEFAPNLINKQDAGILFRVISGGNLREVLLDFCKKQIGSTPKYNALMEWLKA